MTTRNQTVNAVSDIYLADLKFRMPSLIISEFEGNLDIETGGDDDMIFTSNNPDRAKQFQEARTFFMIDGLAPIINEIPRNSLPGNKHLPLWFKVISPEQGFTEYKWDGGKWMSATERSDKRTVAGANSGNPNI